MRWVTGRTVLAFAAGAAVAAALTAGYLLSRPGLPLDGRKYRGPKTFEARVVRVVDGDTVVLENGLHLRYAGIDTPEVVEVVERKEAYLARKAMERNRLLVEGKTLRIDLTDERVDRYGRLLGRVYLDDDTPVEEILVGEGLARTLPMGGTSDRLQRLEQETRAAGKGIWSGEHTPVTSAEAAFVASRNSDLYHLPDCPKALNIKPGNLILFRSVEDARSSKRQPCPFCLPEKQDR